MRTLTIPRMSSDDDPPQGGDDDEPPHPRSLPVPSTVWFGPKRLDSVERELTGFLGSHNGVAVLQWPRDRDRARRLADDGVPRLWLTPSPPRPEDGSDGLDDWVSPSAGQDEITVRLRHLAELAAARRTEAVVHLDGGHLEFGSHRIALTASEYCLASVLVAHFEEAVPDAVLTQQLGEPRLTSQLIHLNQDLSPLGLEVVPVPVSSHRLGRCQSALRC